MSELGKWFIPLSLVLLVSGACLGLFVDTSSILPRFFLISGVGIFAITGVTEFFLMWGFLSE